MLNMAAAAADEMDADMPGMLFWLLLLEPALDPVELSKYIAETKFAKN